MSKQVVADDSMQRRRVRARRGREGNSDGADGGRGSP